MSNDTMVTVQGWLGSPPQLRDAAGTQVANFRVGCTPRRFSRAQGAWVDGPTQWYGVSAWRALGEHCARSLHMGDPVVVHGRLNQRSYERNGVEVPVLEIDAVTVGHDLSRGVSSFSTPVGTAGGAQPARAAASGTAPERDPWDVPGSRPDEAAAPFAPAAEEDSDAA
jgi:single-strand DNA-binding protein